MSVFQPVFIYYVEPPIYSKKRRYINVIIPAIELILLKETEL